METSLDLRMRMVFESIEDVKNNLPEGCGVVVYPVEKGFRLYSNPVDLKFRVVGEGVNPARCQTFMSNMSGCLNLHKNVVVVVNGNSLYCVGDKSCKSFCENKGFSGR